MVLLRSMFAPRIGLLNGSRIHFRVWPFDCDINLHLTNARYFALCDLSRIYYMGQVGVLFEMLKRKWLPVVQAQEISYFRPINPFQRFEIQTSFSYWDDKYWYTEHKFMAANRLCAVIQVRGVFVHGKNIIPTGDLLALTGEDITDPDKPDIVEKWQSLIESRKRHPGHRHSGRM